MSRLPKHPHVPISKIADRLFAHLKNIADKRYHLTHPRKSNLSSSRQNKNSFMYFDEILFFQISKESVWIAILGQGRKLINSEPPTTEPLDQFRIAFMPLPLSSHKLCNLFVRETKSRKKQSNTGDITIEPFSEISRLTLASGTEKKLSEALGVTDTGKDMLILNLEEKFPRCFFSGSHSMDDKAHMLNGIFKGDPTSLNDATVLDMAHHLTAEVLKVIHSIPQEQQ